MKWFVTVLSAFWTFVCVLGLSLLVVQPTRWYTLLVVAVLVIGAVLGLVAFVFSGLDAWSDHYRW